MPSMTAPTPSRVLLVAEPSPLRGPHAAKVRRYRLARMRLLERRAAGPARHAHLTRAYD
jgi:hypothetical protein